MTQYLGVNTTNLRRTSIVPDSNHFAPPEIVRHTLPFESKKSNNEVIKLIVGGDVFRIRHAMLKSVPETRLAELTKESPYYDEQSHGYFFDRNPVYFNCILDYYREGEIHIPAHICVNGLENEFRFWGLNESCLSPCCRRLFNSLRDQVTINNTVKEAFVKNQLDSNTSSIRTKIWSFLENPDESVWAKIWATSFYIFVVMSIFSFFVGTLPSCRVTTGDIDFSPNNGSQEDQQLLKQALNNSKLRMLLTTRPLDSLRYLDMFCLIFFTIEFIVRLYVCPQRLHLLKCAITLFDILYLVPGWLLFIIDLIDRNFWRQPHRISNFLVIQAFMIVRVFRLFRLVRHYRGLRALLLAIKSSIGELLLLFVFVTFAMVIYASFIYCTEIFEENGFENMFIGLWWSLITMTTVGYGDYYPKTWAGYIVASFCAVTGLLVIGMPMPLIANNFHTYYAVRHSCPDRLYTDFRPERLEIGPSLFTFSKRNKLRSSQDCHSVYKSDSANDKILGVLNVPRSKATE